jgi:hypothetical protein
MVSVVFVCSEVAMKEAAMKEARKQTESEVRSSSHFVGIRFKDSS